MVHLLGYTSEELEKYFSEYINNAVDVLNKKYHTERYTHDVVVSELKRNYDGYRQYEVTSANVNSWIYRVNCRC